MKNKGLILLELIITISVLSIIITMAALALTTCLPATP
ncbi:prepilin-type N-terminal cleavage/methylation domain-containing protein [Photobacterium leiognathi]